MEDERVGDSRSRVEEEAADEVEEEGRDGCDVGMVPEITRRVEEMWVGGSSIGTDGDRRTG